EAVEVLGCHVTRVYGSSEFPTFSCGRLGDPPEICADTDGLPIGPVEGRLDGTSDGVGELLVKGPELFSGYFDSSLDADAFTDDAAVTLADLTSFLDAHRLARQKHPERLELIDQLPTTASGKVQKFVLRALIREKVSHER